MKIDGLPVYDAKGPIAFTVTRRDARIGGVQNPDSCAMALACKRYSGAKAVRIHINFSYVLEKDHWLRYRTPPSVAREIVAFDRGGSFAPGDYMLLAPSKSIRLGLIRGPRQRSIRRARKNFIHITANVRTRPVFSRVMPE